jgi:hypothetical protein
MTLTRWNAISERVEKFLRSRSSGAGYQYRLESWQTSKASFIVASREFEAIHKLAPRSDSSGDRIASLVGRTAHRSIHLLGNCDYSFGRLDGTSD